MLFIIGNISNLIFPFLSGLFEGFNLEKKIMMFLCISG